MNRIKRSITVRFFSIAAKEELFNSFVTNFISNKETSPNARILNLKNKKHLVKITSEFSFSGITAYPVTVVKERNTWQTRATSDGLITGITLNQGIIGDPYFFFVVPNKKLLIGFTTGPSGSLKTVGKIMLEQFHNDRLDRIKLDLLPKENQFSTLSELPEYSSLHFRINSSSLSDLADDTPQLIRDLGKAPYIDSNMQLSLDLEFNSPETNSSSLSRESLIEIVNFLSDDEGCSVLKVKGKDVNGVPIQLDFANAFITFKTEIATRNKFIDENSSLTILKEALIDYLANS